MFLWIRKRFPRLILGALVFWVSLVLVLPAQGHGYIVRSSPEARSVLPRAPKQVQIWFSEGLAPEISTIEVYNQAGEQIDLGNGGLDPDNPAKLQVSLPNNLPNGAYLVRMRPVFTSDGHAVNDTLVFWIGEQVGNIEAEGASDRAEPLEALWRAVLYVSLSVLFGAYWMYALVLRPSWGNPRWRSGQLPPRVMKRLSVLVWSSVLVAWLTNLLSLLQITMTLFEANLSQIVQNELWNITLAGTAFGDAWGYRMGLLTAILFLQVIAAQQAQNRPQSTHVLWLVNGGLTLLVLGTLSLISHAGGAPFWRVGALLVDFGHMAGVAAWVGGLLIFAIVLNPALAPLNPADRFRALKIAVGRFSGFAAFLILLIIATGIFSSFMTLTHPNDLPQTTYGLTLLAKWILMFPAFILGALHYLSLNPQRFSHFEHQIRRLPQTLRLEAIFALGIIFAAGWLPATPPPQPNLVPEIAEIQRLALNGVEVELTITPSAIGSNSYDVAVSGISAQGVTLRFSDPEFGRYTSPLVLDEINTGEWGGASGEVYRATTWYALLDVYTLEGEPLRAAFEWRFTEKAVQGRQANLFNFLALAVLILLGVWASATYIPWQPHYGLLALGLGLMSILIAASVLWFSAENSRRLEERRNPRPEVNNPIFPAQDSVQNGAQIYIAECASCHDSPENPSLQPLERSEADLWRILSRGMVNRHFYGNELSEPERWDLINFLRQREGDRF